METLIYDMEDYLQEVFDKFGIVLKDNDNPRFTHNKLIYSIEGESSLPYIVIWVSSNLTSTEKNEIYSKLKSEIDRIKGTLEKRLGEEIVTREDPTRKWFSISYLQNFKQK